MFERKYIDRFCDFFLTGIKIILTEKICRYFVYVSPDYMYVSV